MTNASLSPLLAAARLGDSEARCEVSDWAVNTIRSWARGDRGRGLRAAEVMMGEERARIEAGRLTLVAYLRVSRAGSRYRLDRATRRAVWAQLAIVRSK